jgi:hypothetical protein
VSTFLGSITTARSDTPNDKPLGSNVKA